MKNKEKINKDYAEVKEIPTVLRCDIDFEPLGIKVDQWEILTKAEKYQILADHFDNLFRKEREQAILDKNKPI